MGAMEGMEGARGYASRLLALYVQSICFFSSYRGSGRVLICSPTVSDLFFLYGVLRLVVARYVLVLSLMRC